MEIQGNSFTDFIGPVFEDCIIKRNSDEEIISFTDLFVLNKENITTAYLSDNKFLCYLKLYDDGGGLESLSITKKRIYDGSYNGLSEDSEVLPSKIETSNKTAYFGDYDESTGIYNPHEFDLSEDEDGVYEFKFIAKDLCGNATTKKIYVIKDTVADVITDIELIGGDGKITLSWKNSADIDVSSIQIIRENESLTLQGSIRNSNTSVSFEDDGLNNGTTYSYKFVANDIFGHTNTYSVKRSTIPKKFELSSLQRIIAQNITEKQNPYCFDVILKETSGSNYTETFIYISTDDSIKNFSVLTPYKYKYINDELNITTNLPNDSYEYRTTIDQNYQSTQSVLLYKDSSGKVILGGKKYYLYFVTTYVDEDGTLLKGSVVQYKKNSIPVIPEVSYRNVTVYDSEIDYINGNTEIKTEIFLNQNPPFETFSYYKIGSWQTISTEIYDGQGNIIGAATEEQLVLEDKQYTSSVTLDFGDFDYYSFSSSRVLIFYDDENECTDRINFEYICPFNEVSAENIEFGFYADDENYNFSIKWTSAVADDIEIENLAEYIVVFYNTDSLKDEIFRKSVTKDSSGNLKTTLITSIPAYLFKYYNTTTNNAFYFNILKKDINGVVCSPYTYSKLKYKNETVSTVSNFGN